MRPAGRGVAIAGVGLSDYPRSPLSQWEHHALAMQRALDDCGAEKSSIDGYMTAGAHDEAVMMAEYLGITPRYIDSTMTGGSSFEVLCQHAVAAIEQDMCGVVLITYGSAMLSQQGRSLGTRLLAGPKRVAGPGQFESPYGNTLVGAYAMAAQLHMHRFGTTPEQLAEVAVAARRHAAFNPHAMYSDPITVEDVLSSRMIASPLHLLDCCVISDGGGALIITTAERARDLARPPAYVLAATAAQTHWNISQMPDFTTTAAAISGPEAFARAQVSPEDIDTVQLYDSFTITVLLLLEDLGFCAKGEGGAFVEGGRLAPGGTLPANTDGGGLSACHPGMRGIFLLVEAVRQLRGDAGEAQVPDCSTALACGSGGWLSCMGTVILSTEPA
jgi:acetyl-CoA acetyltransferase